MPPLPQPVQALLTCDQCKSTFFFTARAEEFLAGGYGTAEWRSVSNAPKTILVCVGCGKAVTPKQNYYAKGTQAAIAEEHFAESVKNGNKFREKNSIQHVAQIAASPDELAALKKEVEDLRQALNSMTADKTLKPKQKKPTEVKAHDGAQV